MEMIKASKLQYIYNQLMTKRNYRNLKQPDAPSDMTDEFSKFSKVYSQYHFNPEAENLKNIVCENASISKQEMNQIFELHNTATDDDVYGERLFTFLLNLVDNGQIRQEWAVQVFVLSIDWPLDLKI